MMPVPGSCIVDSFGRGHTRRRWSALLLVSLTVPSLGFTVPVNIAAVSILTHRTNDKDCIASKGVALSFAPTYQSRAGRTFRLGAVGESAEVAEKTADAAASATAGGAKFMNRLKILLGGKTTPASLIKRVSLRSTEFLAIAFFGWCSIPISRFIYNNYITTFRNKSEEEQAPPFARTLTYQLALHLSQASQIAFVLCLVNASTAGLQSRGIMFPYQMQYTEWLAKIMYTVWVALRVMAFKRQLIVKAAIKAARNFRSAASAINAEKNGDQRSNPKKELGKASVYNSFLNILISTAAGLFLLDVFHVQMGRALKSVFAFGGLGTVVFSYASKDLASQLVHGRVMIASDRFYEGEVIELGDGTVGKVVRIGLLDTEILGPDEVVLSIPNSDLLSHRVQNLSRASLSRITQTLRFRYVDIQRLPRIISDIRAEIEKCPEVIKDGSKPLLVSWNNFGEHHIEVVVDCRVKVDPSSAVEVSDARDKVLGAIAHAAKNNWVAFAHA